MDGDSPRGKGLGDTSANSDAANGPQLRELLEQEREILCQMQALIDKLDEDEPYRAILEQALGKFQDAAVSLEKLAQGPLRWLNGDEG